MATKESAEPMVSVIASYIFVRSKVDDFLVCVCEASNPESLPPDVVARTKKKSGKCEITVIGTFLPTLKGVQTEYIGRWEENSRFGIQFHAYSYSMIVPEEPKALAQYISYSVKGVGKGISEAIVTKFGEDSIAIIENDPIRLCEIRGISRKKAQTISLNYSASRGLFETVSFLGKFGVSVEKASRVYTHFQGEAIQTAKANPYLLLEVEGISFASCDLIARMMNVMMTSDMRIVGCTKEVIETAKNTGGHFCLDYPTLEKECLLILNEGIPEEEHVSVECFREAFKRAVSEKKFVVSGKKWVYTSLLEYTERSLAENISERLKNNYPASRAIEARSEVDRWERNNPGFKLADSQRDAIINSISNRVSIITGGPGTGKTTVTNVVLQAYEKLSNMPITLLAPTGKAARRMSESCGRPATTIHRALGLYTGKEGESATNGMLPTGLVVVDEVSMMDQYVAKTLFDCIPKDGQIILVGDEDQLPSVGAGNVLHELIESGSVPYTKLSVIFRQGKGSPIVTNAHKINSGDTKLEYDKELFRAVGVKDDEDAENKILKYYAYEVAKYGIENVVILCPMRTENERIAAVNLNKLLQKKINPILDGEVTVNINGYQFHQRDRIMQTKNNPPYAANGEVGMLRAINNVTDDGGHEAQEFVIEWENGNHVTYTKDDMRHVELAYAITIHKSQGSEYQCCIIPMLSKQKIMLHRNLLYTGVTRAKKEVVIIGEKKAVDTAVSSVDDKIRYTLLGARIKYLCKDIAKPAS